MYECTICTKKNNNSLGDIFYHMGYEMIKKSPRVEKTVVQIVQTYKS